MSKVIELPQEKETVLQCNQCGGQSFLVLASSDGARVTGFECLTCCTRELFQEA